MRELLTPRQMRKTEQEYMCASGVSGLELMERAAAGLCEALTERFGKGRSVYFACGVGGNGGDGYACARLYRQAGGNAVVVEIGEVTHPDAARMREKALEAGVPFAGDWRNLPAPGVWVDALYGIGLNRPVEGESALLIRRMNAESAPVVSVDVPSGLDAAAGRAFDPCVRADMTVTFHREKLGHFLNDGLDVCGEILVRDIGIPDSFLPGGAALLVEKKDVSFAPRRRSSFKGTYGHALIVAGSRGMAGAAAMCAMAALRGGAGLVTVACPASNLPIMQILVPCAMCVPLPEEDGAISREAVGALKEALAGKTCAAIGCGLSLRCAPEAVRTVLESPLPAVLDADALNLIAKDESLKALLRPRHVITPHPGEARRLLGRDLTDPVADAVALRGMGPQALLKGASSVIAAGEKVYVSSSGCPGMAKGGSGDALTGLMAALLAQGCAPERAAYAASELHGLAGEAAQAEWGERGMLATDLIAKLGLVPLP